ncbi:MAG: ParB/RepB/Spo0J family partition protein [Syntrophales bacterium]|jgi:ParB family chromosome partitioning protein|nr:ParB/RepB/Spo0J family partition protein [Syntrophales bacterium]
MASTPTYEKGKLYYIPIIDFRLDPNQPRKVFDEAALTELTDSIKKHGILQPLLFLPGEQGHLTVVSGERRLAAAKNAGILTIPAMMVDGNPAEIALVENLIRQDLTAVEEAEALQRLMNEQNYNQEQLAGVINKARTTLNEVLSLNRLPLAIRDECRGDRSVSRRTLVEIARRKQERGMLSAWEKYKETVKKQQEGRRKVEKIPPTPPELKKWFDKTRGKLTDADAVDWSNDDRTAVNESLTALREAIDVFLNPEPR